MRRRIALLAGLAWLLAAGAAAAGPPGQWTRITDPSGRNIDEIGLARTPDNILHVAWLRPNGTNEDLVHTTVSQRGLVLATNPIQSNWATLTFPSLVYLPAGQLVTYFSGIRTTDSSDPYARGSLYQASGPPSGASWALGSGPGGAAGVNSVYASPYTTAAVNGSGQPVLAWAWTGGVFSQIGDGGVSQHQTACCGYAPGIGVDGTTGQAWLAWYSNANDGRGHFVARVGQGGRTQVPGSVTTFNGQPSSIEIDQLVAITGRRDAAGVFVGYGAGYPTYRSVDVWEIGDAAPRFVIGVQDAGHVALASAPGGRLWIIWEQRDIVFAARTNAAATSLGEIVRVGRPPGTQTVFKTRGDAALGYLDLFVHQGTVSNQHSTWHTQVLPGLTLTASGSRPVSFRVADAGDPVRGARIRVGGRTLTTDGQGRASARLRGGRYTAVVSKAGYTADSVRVRAR
jgi:hypothetical protein